MFFGGTLSVNRRSNGVKRVSTLSINTLSKLLSAEIAIGVVESISKKSLKAVDEVMNGILASDSNCSENLCLIVLSN